MMLVLTLCNDINPAPVSSQAPPPALVATATEIQEEKVRGVTGTAPPTTQQAPPSAIVATEIQEQKECKVTVTAPPTTPKALPTKQATPLFHPGSLSVYLGETYDYLSQHINSYFSSLTKAGSDVAPPVSSRAEPPLSVSKGLGSYLRVQGFIGSYITPLVPRFRTEPGSAPVEVEEAGRRDTVQSDDQRARRLRQQREKVYNV